MKKNHTRVRCSTGVLVFFVLYSLVQIDVWVCVFRSLLSGSASHTSSLLSHFCLGLRADISLSLSLFSTLYPTSANLTPKPLLSFFGLTTFAAASDVMVQKKKNRHRRLQHTRCFPRVCSRVGGTEHQALPSSAVLYT